jgi:plastocyanin
MIRLTRCCCMLALSALVGMAGCDQGVGPGDSPADTTLLDRLTAAPRGVDVHLVRVVASGDEFGFQPSEVVVRSGDVVRFVMVTSQPQSVAFSVSDLTPGAEQFVRDTDLMHGELLTSAGEVYDVSFRDAPPGRYPFHSIVHAARGMRGVIVVE